MRKNRGRLLSGTSNRNTKPTRVLPDHPVQLLSTTSAGQGFFMEFRIMKYTIKAHPTMYNGVQYRSRLEARWAAFFDLIEWQHEYEPIDLPGWSPDFLLHGSKTKILVEVKPVYDIPNDVANKINRAVPVEFVSGDSIAIVKPENSFFECLIVGNAPIWRDYSCSIGWLREYDDWEEAPFMHLGELDFCHATQSYIGRITGKYDGHWGDEHLALEIVKRCWSEAGNIVQWRPRR
jgi:hypothetical protein